MRNRVAIGAAAAMALMSRAVPSWLIPTHRETGYRWTAELEIKRAVAAHQNPASSRQIRRRAEIVIAKHLARKRYTTWREARQQMRAEAA